MPRARPGILLTGAAGGGFAGLTGVGGGALLIPLMTGLLRMRQHTAHGTSLVIIVFAAAASAVAYQLDGAIDWELVGLLLLGSLAGAYIGARAVQYLPAMRLRQVLGVFQLCIAIRLLLVHTTDPLLDVQGFAEAAAGAGIGLTGGITAGALGVGGGAIFVPGAVILLGTGQHEAQGASLAVIVVTALVGAWTHNRHGSLDLEAARGIIVAALPAGLVGAVVASQLDGATLQRIFALVLLAVGAQVLFTATRALRLASQPPAAGVAPETGQP